MSKLKGGETAVWVTEQAVQILGGYGYIKDFPVEKWYRDSKIYTIYEEPEAVRRDHIAVAANELVDDLLAHRSAELAAALPVHAPEGLVRFDWATLRCNPVLIQ